MIKTFKKVIYFAILCDLLFFLIYSLLKVAEFSHDISDEFKITNPNFTGVILDYRNAVEFSKNYIKPPYKKFRGICPSWDNEARKPGRGTVLVNSTPDSFKQWLKILCRFTETNFEPDERIIFINAWNEWAEGNHLEPCIKYGSAFLESVKKVFKNE